ncbi:hypothetical protein WICMUC_002698 [Wickerhamomyces mucosus]|uniref:Uncharacterized protein n=1 Tax=Wickerhamomyces mucosus TaxID=1378264 RepID=A0A9P8PPY8_9ASCO|nr:hypothetical protein WICMUC_002698 [Wickerhamomyces mucosus]
MARIPKNWSKVFTKPVPICKIDKIAKLIINGHFLPYLSAKYPTIIEPTDLNIKTNVIAQVISLIDLSKSLDKFETLIETAK